MAGEMTEILRRMEGRGPQAQTQYARHMRRREHVDDLGGDAGRAAAVLLFFYFLFSFFTKIYFCFRNLHEYTPAAPLLGGRDLVAQLRGGRGFSAKILRNFLQKNPWRTGRPAAGRPAPQAAQQRGDRLPHPYIRVG